jgi:hypothetical protein
MQPFTATAIAPRPPHGNHADENETRWRATTSSAYLSAKTHGWPRQITVGKATIDSDPGRPAATLRPIEALT